MGAIIISGMIIILANKCMMCGFILWLVAVMISNLNDHKKTILNHVRSLSVSKITYITCAIEICGFTTYIYQNANSQPTPTNCDY